MEKILVTDSSGYVGEFVIKHLVDQGLRPLAGVRNIERVSRFLNENSEILFLDYSNIESIEKALSHVDKLFLVPPMDPDMSLLMQNVLNYIGNVQHIVCISVSGADPNSTSPLLRSHGEIRQNIIDTDIPHTFLAPSTFYQNYIEFCAKSVKEEGCFYFPQGIASKSMIDTYDVAEVAARVLMEDGHKGKVYNLAGYDYNNNEIALTLTKILEKDVEYIDILPEVYANMLLENGMSAWKREIFLKLNASWKNGSRLKSNEELKRLLKREPRTFEEFLKREKGKFEKDTPRH